VATFDITLGILYFSKTCETGKPCVDQSGPRAALLGSIAAGLRGQDGLLA